MPYKANTDLPESVRHVLPEHAQSIYREAYNHAAKEYKNPHDRDNPKESSEEVAHKVAWAAVKKEYEKKESTGKWEKK